MPDKKPDNKPADIADKDVVPREDYNKLVEAQNSLKIVKEQLEKKLKETEEKKEEKKVEDEKKTWEKEKAELEKQNEELRKKAEKTVSKGIIQEKKLETKVLNKEEFKKQLEKHIPEQKKDPATFKRKINKYGYYKAPTSDFTNEQLGMALSLDAQRQQSEPHSISNFAKIGKQDKILRGV